MILGLTVGGLCMGGCSDIDFDLERYKGAVKDGFDKIPQSKEIEELLGDADHFISYSGNRSVGQDWNTKVYFAGRYCLTMQVEVKVDRRFSRITKVTGQPKFYLVETIRVDLNRNGTVGALHGQGYQFGPEDWKKVVAAKGDFSVIGIHLKLNRPVPNFDKYVKAMRRPCIQVHPHDRTAGSEMTPSPTPTDHPTSVQSRQPTPGLATDLRSSRLSSPSVRSLLGHQRPVIVAAWFMAFAAASLVSVPPAASGKRATGSVLRWCGQVLGTGNR